jgi:hypothetical protein
MSARKTEGGKYSLTELYDEERRRKKKNYSGEDVVKTILKLSKMSEDGLVTYRQVWSSFCPGREWKGNSTQKEVANMLFSAIYYCASLKEKNLPIVTSLVVRQASREAGEAAKQNIFDTARKCGIDTGHDVEAFYHAQKVASLKLASSMSV